MKNEFIPYTESLDLKELGFDEPCLMFYRGTDKELVYAEYYGRFKNSSYVDKSTVSAPLHQQAFRWFRDRCPESDFGVAKIYNGTNNYHYHINLQWEFFEGSYEKAELECLRKLIEVVKNKL